MHVLVAGPVDLGELAAWLPNVSLPDARTAPAVTRLVAGLLAAGHGVTVASTSLQVPAGGPPVEISGDGLRVVLGHRRAKGRARDAFAAERDFFRVATEAAGADVVHAHWTYEEALGCLAARPDTVVTARDWGPTVLRHHRHPYRVVRLGMQLAALRRAAHVTAPSPYLADRVRRVHGNEVAVVPNPIAAADVVSAPRAWPTGAPRLLAVNNGWGPLKNMGALLRAFLLVRRARPDATLDLYGDGYGEGGAAQRFAVDEGLAAGVSFHGRVALGEIVAAMDTASVFVHPSREESFGNVLVEAMARGVPIVAGRSSGAVPWVVGEGGCLVDVESSTAIAEAVLELCDDDGAWERASRAGHANVVSRFRTDAVVAAYAEVYRRVMP